MRKGGSSQHGRGSLTRPGLRRRVDPARKPLRVLVLGRAAARPASREERTNPQQDQTSSRTAGWLCGFGNHGFLGCLVAWFRGPRQCSLSLGRPGRTRARLVCALRPLVSAVPMFCAASANSEVPPSRCSADRGGAGLGSGHRLRCLYLPGVRGVMGRPRSRCCRLGPMVDRPLLRSGLLAAPGGTRRHARPTPPFVLEATPPTGRRGHVHGSCSAGPRRGIRRPTGISGACYRRDRALRQGVNLPVRDAPSLGAAQKGWS